MNAETTHTFDRLCRRYTLHVVHRVSDPDRQVQTNTAEALIRRGLAYTYQTATHGRTRILAPTREAHAEWVMAKLAEGADPALEELRAMLPTNHMSRPS